MVSHNYGGILSKYTNVMKGWQPRWFSLDATNGLLLYYLSEPGEVESSSPRGVIRLRGAVIFPSAEDSYSFTINSCSGVSYKLRALDARFRQEWVNRLRTVAMNALTPHRTSKRSMVPSDSPMFQVENYLSEAQHKYLAVASEIENLESSDNLNHTDPNLLSLKACSNSLISSLQECADLLSQATDLQS